MKYLVYSIFLLLVLVTPFNAQQPVSRILYGDDYYGVFKRIEYFNDGSSITQYFQTEPTSVSGIKIGKIITYTNESNLVEIHNFDLGYILYDLTKDGAALNVTNATLSVKLYNSHTPPSSENFQTVLLSDNIQSIDTPGQWSTIVNAPALQTTGYYSILSINVTSLVNVAIPSGKIIFGIRSENLDDFSDAIMYAKLSYTGTVEQANITAKNKMDTYEGGEINVGLETNASQRTSPYPFTTQIGNDVNLSAIENQSHDGYNWVWNDTEASNYKSKWEKETLTGTFNISDNQSTTYTVQSGDDGANLIANLRKVCNITFKNEHSGGENGGTIEVNGTTYNSPTSTFNVIEQNTITGYAIDHTLDMIEFEFSKWTPTNSTSREKTFTISSHDNIEANFIGKPDFNQTFRNLHFNSYSPRIQQYVKLYWNEHPNDNVTQYRIWRKGKELNGNNLPDEIIATVNRGTTAYTDYDYYLTSGYSDALLQYDVQAYYQPDNTFSEQDYITVYGEGSAVEKRALQDSLENFITKYEYGISNFPNPYNPTTTISYQVKEPGNVNIAIYDALGRKIRSLVDGVKQAGSYNVKFDGSNLSSGIYFYTMKVNDFVASKKMLLTK